MLSTLPALITTGEIKVTPFTFTGAVQQSTLFGIQYKTCYASFLEVPIPLTPNFFLLGWSPLKLAKPYKKVLRHVPTVAHCFVC